MACNRIKFVIEIECSPMLDEMRKLEKLYHNNKMWVGYKEMAKLIKKHLKSKKESNGNK